METSVMRTGWKIGLWSLCLAVGLSAFPPVMSAPRDDFDEDRKSPIQTISTRPDRVSGGDVLVEISSVERKRQPIEIKVNGRDVSSSFRPGTRPDKLMGLVTGLEIGRNRISAGGDTLVVTNYPISGPITSGPHIAPFICETHRFQLPDGTPYTPQPILDDRTCSAPTRINYLYMPAAGKELVPLPSTSNLPADIATTTTIAGATVKFIVRVETSTINRGIYQSAILHDPTVDPEPTPFSPPKGWNRRLIAVEGFGCRGGWYRQGPNIGNLTIENVPFVLLQLARLREGYALFSNTLQHPTNNCNAVLSGEAAMMSKEHFIETYGEPHFTLSAGASGGSYGSFQLADALPGLFDGVLVALTFPDPMSIALSGMDARLLATYFVSPKAADLTPGQKAAISGYKLSGADGMQAMVDAARQSGRADPVTGRVVPGIPEYDSGIHSVVPPADRYDPRTNPRGVRATVYDVSRNVYGVDPKTGFALRTFDNVGVQYGWSAFTAGTITAKQFLDLNEAIGGLDQDANAIDHAVSRRSWRHSARISKRPAVRWQRWRRVDPGRERHRTIQRGRRLPLSVVPFRHARAHGAGERQRGQPRELARQDENGAVRGHVEPARQLGRREQEGYRPGHDAREDPAQQAVERRRWLLEEPDGVHPGAGGAQQQTRHAV